MKFGGTSMAGIERIRNVAGRVQREAEAGNEVLVVVSAMAGTTNALNAMTSANFIGKKIDTKDNEVVEVKLNEIDGEDFSERTGANERPNPLHRAGESIRQIDAEKPLGAPGRVDHGRHFSGVPA